MIKGMLVAVFFITVIAITSKMDAQDEADQFEHYTKMVCSGAWPDYKKIGVDCEGR